MKFRATVTDFIRDYERPRVKGSTRKTVVALAVDDTKNDCPVIVLKQDKVTSVIQMENIRAVHKSCISEGKITLVLRAVSYQIKANAAEVRRLVTIIESHGKTGRIDKKFRLPKMRHLDLKMPKKDDEKILITSSAQLSSPDRYTRTATCLTIQNVKLSGFDSRIFRLQHLRSLTLEGAGLTTLPSQFDLLPNLTFLNLTGNNLGLSSNWRWVCCPSLRTNLLLLDLSNNQIRNLPIDVCRLSTLNHLSLNNNKLRFIPNAIGKMQKLKELLLKDNELLYLPWNIINLRLKTCDYSGQLPEPNGREVYLEQTRRSEVPSLVDLAANVAVNEKREYSEEEVPRHLCDYMLNATSCYKCGRLVLPPTPNLFFSSRGNFADDIRYDGDGPGFHVGSRVCSFCERRKFSLFFYE